MGSHSLSRNSLTTDAISYLVVSHPPLYRSRFKFKEHDLVLCISVCCITMCRCLANFSLKNYDSNERKYARGNMRWESVLIAHCPSRCFMPHCIVVFISIFWMNIHAQNLAHLAKHRNRDYLSVCTLDRTS